MFAYEDFAGGDYVVLGDEAFSSERNFNVEKFQSFSKQVLAGVPLSYISHKCHFLDNELFVDQRVLIPRSETEVLVDLLAKKYIKNLQQPVAICDVGTGSGCIAIGLLTESDRCLQMTALDISQDALDVAKFNFFKHQFRMNPESQCQFLQSDRLAAVTGKEFDIIVSNPPYIKEQKDRHEVHPTVLQHEPHLALFLKDESYDHWFEDFFRQIYQALRPNGIMALECSELHVQKLLVLAQDLGFNKVKIEKDLTGKERFLLAVKGEDSHG